MSLSAPKPELKQRPIAPIGTHAAICFSIIDVGSHMKSYQNKDPKKTALVQFGWEFPNLPFAVFKEGDPAKPLAIFQEYTVSLDDRSKLFQALSAWRGVPPTDLAKDLPVFLGQPCLINVVHAPNKTNPSIIYANIANGGVGIMRVPQGMPVGNRTNPTMLFNLDTYSHDQFMKLPEWIQKKIQSSLEWSGIVAKFGPPPVQAQTQQQPNTQFTQQGNQNAAFNQSQANNFNQTQVNSFNQPPQNTASFGGETIKGNPFDGPAPF